MRKLILLPLLCSLCFAQGIGGKAGFGGKAGGAGGAVAACSTPTGTNITESFGDSITSCWAAGPASCNNTWTIQSGTSESIIATPAGAPTNTACSQSLQMVLTAGAGLITLPITGATLDINFTLYVTSNGLSNFNEAPLISISQFGGGGSQVGEVGFNQQPGQLTLEGFGTAASAGVNISLNTWYTVNLHLASGAAASYITVNGGAHQTFTENANTAGFIGIGDGAATSYTAVIGNLYVN
jgi:hypothetical protein